VVQACYARAKPLLVAVPLRTVVHVNGKDIRDIHGINIAFTASWIVLLGG
jgi:hypothetical protein